jgi:hypothetical protein
MKSPGGEMISKLTGPSEREKQEKQDASNNTYNQESRIHREFYFCAIVKKIS